MSKGKHPAALMAAIFIALELAAFGMLSSSRSLQNIWLTRFSGRVLSFLWGGTESAREFFSLREENDRLALENFRLGERIRELEGLQTPEISAPRRDGFEYLPATVVKMSRNSQHNYIIVDKGSEDGVTPSSGIITSEGVVGIISAVGRKYSYGMTLLNARTSVSARIGRDGPVVPMKWDGLSRKGFRLTDVPLHTAVAPGDTVYTSGQSDLFPGGIPLGTTGETENVAGSSTMVRVLPFCDFSALHYVTLCHNPSRAEIAGLEKKEEKR